jgi:hypothetical protein
MRTKAMTDLRFCRQQLEEIVEYTTVGSLQANVEKFLRVRMPSAAGERAALGSWAMSELAKLEVTPGSGTTKPLFTAYAAAAGRRIAMLQTVVNEIEAAECGQSGQA